MQIDGIDAVWQVTSAEVRNKLPWSLEMVCYVRWGGVDFTIRGHYFDNRPERTAKDFDEAKAEVLAIIQSFRLLKAVEDTDSTEAKKNPYRHSAIR